MQWCHFSLARCWKNFDTLVANWLSFQASKFNARGLKKLLQNYEESFEVNAIMKKNKEGLYETKTAKKYLTNKNIFLYSIMASTFWRTDISQNTHLIVVVIVAVQWVTVSSSKRLVGYFNFVAVHSMKKLSFGVKAPVSSDCPYDGKWSYSLEYRTAFFDVGNMESELWDILTQAVMSFFAITLEITQKMLALLVRSVPWITAITCNARERVVLRLQLLMPATLQWHKTPNGELMHGTDGSKYTNT